MNMKFASLGAKVTNVITSYRWRDVIVIVWFPRCNRLERETRNTKLVNSSFIWYVCYGIVTLTERALWDNYIYTLAVTISALREKYKSYIISLHSLIHRHTQSSTWTYAGVKIRKGLQVFPPQFLAYYQTKPYVVATQKNLLSEKIIMRTHNTGFWGQLRILEHEIRPII